MAKTLFAQRSAERNYGAKWEVSSEEKFDAKKEGVKKVEFQISEEYGTPQLVFHHANGSWTPIKADRDCRDVLVEGQEIDMDSITIKELVNPITGETSIQAYGEAVSDDEEKATPSKRR